MAQQLHKSFSDRQVRALLKRYDDREVLTNHVRGLIQHDSSEHKWAPYAGVKWHPITSLDDHSRLLLHAHFVERETSWDHIQALENVVLRYGAPYAYDTDSHSIFRFVQGRDSIWRKHYLVTDDIDPQRKQVLQECRIDLRYALSPQAKEKIERPCGRLQDRVIRTCARENVKAIGHARKILGLGRLLPQGGARRGPVPEYRSITWSLGWTGSRLATESNF